MEARSELWVRIPGVCTVASFFLGLVVNYRNITVTNAGWVLLWFSPFIVLGSAWLFLKWRSRVNERRMKAELQKMEAVLRTISPAEYLSMFEIWRRLLHTVNAQAVWTKLNPPNEPTEVAELDKRFKLIGERIGAIQAPMVVKDAPPNIWR